METRPSFPTYVGPPLPEQLRWYHSPLLLQWILFQPSRISHYLWQADSELYQQQGWSNLRRSWSIPAYRTLYRQAIILAIWATVLVAMLVSWLDNTSINWLGMAGGVALGMAVGVALGMALGVAVGVAFGVAVGVAAGVAAGVADSVAVGMAAGMALGVALGVAGGVAFGVAFGVALGVALGVAVGAAVGVADSVAVGVAFGGAVSGAGGRLLFYPIELLYYLPPLPRRWRRHAALWSDLAIWPLPQMAALVAQKLTSAEHPNWARIAKIATSPFQQGHVQKGLHQWLLMQPLARLYCLADTPQLDTYLTTPVTRLQFRNWPSAKMVLLADVGQTFLAGTSDGGDTIEKWVWRLTRRQRMMAPTPIAPFAALLGQLLHEQAQLAERDLDVLCNETLAPERYEPIRELEHGETIANSFETIRYCLGLATTADLATSPAHFAWLQAPSPSPLRPHVIEALRGLHDIGRHIEAYSRLSSYTRQSSILLRANGKLEELRTHIQAQVPLPERGLLSRIVTIWQAIVAKEQQVLSNRQQGQQLRSEQEAVAPDAPLATLWQQPDKPLRNPYIVGPPVFDALFVGRHDILNQISDTWHQKSNPDAIILYGHRRMGKTSILRNLSLIEPEEYFIVYLDLLGNQNRMMSQASFLLLLADQIVRSVRRGFAGTTLARPDSQQYTETEAKRQFDYLLDDVRDIIQPRKLILALDEFEAVQKVVEAGQIDKALYWQLRTLAHEPGLAIIFGGLHQLNEMNLDYSAAFHGSYVDLKVSYLTPAAARALIAEPTELEYEPEQIDSIVAVTGGQPYLIQLICRGIVNHLNHLWFDLNADHDLFVTQDDIDFVLSNDFFQDGHAYFSGVWDQTAENEPIRSLLLTLAQQTTPWSVNEMVAATGKTADSLHPLLTWARRHDILRPDKGKPARWTFCVPLMRQWLAE